MQSLGQGDRYVLGGGSWQSLRIQSKKTHRHEGLFLKSILVKLRRLHKIRKSQFRQISYQLQSQAVYPMSFFKLLLKVSMVLAVTVSSLKEFHRGATLVEKKFCLLPVACWMQSFLLWPLVMVLGGANSNILFPGHREQSQLVSISWMLLRIL